MSNLAVPPPSWSRGTIGTIGTIEKGAGTGDGAVDGYPRIMGFFAGFVARKRGEFVANVPTVADCAFGVEQCKWLSDIEKSEIVADSRDFRNITTSEI